MLGRLEITLELQSIDTKSRLQSTSYGLNIYVHYYSNTAIKVLQHKFPCSFTIYTHTFLSSFWCFILWCDKNREYFIRCVVVVTMLHLQRSLLCITHNAKTACVCYVNQCIEIFSIFSSCKIHWKMLVRRVT